MSNIECAIDLPNDIIEATFISRINRFVAEIEVEGRSELAHVPSSGRMSELLYNGAAVFAVPQNKPGLKLKYKLLLAKHGDYLVSVDSLLPNRLVRKALTYNGIPELSGYNSFESEISFGKGRFDFYLQHLHAPACYLEVKSVTLVKGETAMFPDAPTKRGTRHMEELILACSKGYRSVVLFIVQRGDGLCFRPNWEGDYEFSKALQQAATKGVEVLAYKCAATVKQVSLGEKIPVILEEDI